MREDDPLRPGAPTRCDAFACDRVVDSRESRQCATAVEPLLERYEI